MPLLHTLQTSRSPDRREAQAAFTELFQALRPKLRSRLRSFEGELDEHTLEGIVADAILRATFGRVAADEPVRARFEPSPDKSDGALVSYVGTTAHRMAIDALRARGRQPSPSQLDPEGLAPSLAASDSQATAAIAARLATLHDELMQALQQLHHRNEQLALFAWSEWRQLKSEVAWSVFVEHNPFHFPERYGAELSQDETRRVAQVLGSVFDLTVDVVPLQGADEHPEQATARAEQARDALIAAGAPERKDPAQRPGRPAASAPETPLQTVAVLPPRVDAQPGLRLVVRDGATCQSNANAAQHFKNSGARLLLALHLLRHHLDRGLLELPSHAAGDRLRAAILDAQARRCAQHLSTPLDTALLVAILDGCEHRLVPDWQAISDAVESPLADDLHEHPDLLAAWLNHGRVRVDLHGPADLIEAVANAVDQELRRVDAPNPERALQRLRLRPSTEGPVVCRWNRPPPLGSQALSARARTHLAELLWTCLHVLLRDRPGSRNAEPQRPAARMGSR